MGVSTQGLRERTSTINDRLSSSIDRWSMIHMRSSERTYVRLSRARGSLTMSARLTLEGTPLKEAPNGTEGPTVDSHGMARAHLTRHEEGPRRREATGVLPRSRRVRLLRQALAEVRHLDGSLAGFPALVAGLCARALNGLIDRVCRDHAKEHRHARVHGDLRHSLAHFR